MMSFLKTLKNDEMVREVGAEVVSKLWIAYCAYMVVSYTVDIVKEVKKEFEK